MYNTSNQHKFIVIFLASAKNDAGFKLVLGKGDGNVGDLNVVCADSALRDISSRLGLRRTQTGLYKGGHNVKLAVGKVIAAKLGTRHIAVVCTATEERLCSSTGFLGYLLTVNKCGELVCKDLLCTVELAALPRLHLVYLLKRQEGQHTDAL